MEFDDLRVTDEGAIATVAIDAAPANVLDAASIRELTTALDELDVDDRNAIVVTGGEGVFCAGVEVEDHLGEDLPRMIEVFDDLFGTMRDLRTPTIASVGGAALGGGLEIVMGCDLAVAVEDARFAQPEVGLGTFPPVAAALCPELVGRKRAFELVVQGRELDAEEAAELGLVNRVVPEEELESATHELAEDLAENSGLVLGMARRAFYEAADRPSFDEALSVANDRTIEITETEEGQEGLTAFLEDREPEWRY